MTPPLLLAAGINAAHALPPCTDRATISKHLAAKYHEQPIGLGLASNGGALEVFVSTDQTTWTIVVTMPNNVACMIAVGSDWQVIQPVLTGEAS